MTISNCNTCKAMLFDGGVGLMGNKHVCPPEYEVVREFWEDAWDEAVIVHAYDYDEAATKAAEEHDDGNGEGPSKQTLFVRKKGDSIVKQFAIDFEYSVDYHAYEKAPASD